MEKALNDIRTEVFPANDLAGFAGKAVEAAMDISADTNRIIEMTPKDGYQKKLEIIFSAQDMSTQEKLDAIDAAEDKYARDLNTNAEMYKGVMWTKVGLVLTCTAGIVLMVSSPEGRKLARTILKLVA